MPHTYVSDGIRVANIGRLHHEYGCDTYMRITADDGKPRTLRKVKRHLAELFVREPSFPGAAFCTHVRAVKDGDAWIGIAEIRRDT